MESYLQREIVTKPGSRSLAHALVDALYTKSALRLEYDSAMTRNAAQAFEARTGNCLSLVIMTAAFAKALGIPVYYQSVATETVWARSGDIEFAIDHVNLSLGKRVSEVVRASRFQDVLTVDFLPSQGDARQQIYVLPEKAVIAMYMNNRAAELLVQGRLTDAYWYAREAIVQDPAFVRAYNTLGVVYRRHGDLADAERALRYALEMEPSNVQVISNLAQVLTDGGRAAEAGVLRHKLAQLEAEPPFIFYDRGVAAYRRGDYAAALDLFRREVARAPYYHEFHFWLALTYSKTGDLNRARQELALAMENSTTYADHALYAAKLERLQSHRAQ
ncbi:MAG: tetratricopeptide repeat protein [Burkholderiales bacterium]